MPSLYGDAVDKFGSENLVSIAQIDRQSTSKPTNAPPEEQAWTFLALWSNRAPMLRSEHRTRLGLHFEPAKGRAAKARFSLIVLALTILGASGGTMSAYGGRATERSAKFWETCFL